MEPPVRADGVGKSRANRSAVPPATWQERPFEGRLIRMTPLGEERKISTSIGTRWAVPARVEVLSGLFKGAVYEDALVYSPSLKDQMSGGRPVEGRLGRGSSRAGAPVQWILRQP